MTTSSQPSTLSVAELDALRAAQQDPSRIAGATLEALQAKGMVDGETGRLTPAGEHAIHVNHERPLPGVDN